MSTYLELVNDVIYETKQTLDPLTSANFATPPRTSMYERIKRWVNASYLELLHEKPEWFFTSQRTVMTIRPRVLLTGISGINPLPLPGDVLTFQTSLVSATVVAASSAIEPDDGEDTVQTTVDLTFANKQDMNKIVLNESITINPLAVGPDIVDYARVGGRGRYNFQVAIPTLDNLIPGSIQIQPSIFDPDADHSPTGLQPVYPVDFLQYDCWAYNYYNFIASAARPIAVTQCPDGSFDFFPRPDGLYDVAFQYSQKGVPMVDHDDTPTLIPEKYQSYLMWMACSKLADFNKDQLAFARAKKETDRYMRWLVRDYMQKPRLDLTRFDGHGRQQ